MNENNDDKASCKKSFVVFFMVITMPSGEMHRAFSKDRTGNEYADLHSWIDNDERGLGVNHRKIRHAYTQQDRDFVFKKWGKKGIVEWLFHIALDNIDTAVMVSRDEDAYGGNAYNSFTIAIDSEGNVCAFCNRKSDRQLDREFEDAEE